MSINTLNQRQRTRNFLLISIGVAVTLTQIVGAPAATRSETPARPSPFDAQGTKQFSSAKQVTVLLGQENPAEDGVQHLANAGRTSTSIQTLDGVPCRYLNRLREGRMFGSLYFALSPSFKAQGLKNARVEVEYLAKKDTSFRLQFELDSSRPFQAT